VSVLTANYCVQLWYRVQHRTILAIVPVILQTIIIAQTFVCRKGGKHQCIMPLLPLRRGHNNNFYYFLLSVDIVVKTSYNCAHQRDAVQFIVKSAWFSVLLSLCSATSSTWTRGRLLKCPAHSQSALQSISIQGPAIACHLGRR